MDTLQYQHRVWDGADVSPLQTEFATAHRIPFLTTAYDFRWLYLTGVVVGEGAFPYEGQVPTEEEVAMLAGFLDGYKHRFYTERGRELMKEFAPYDIDEESNLAYFVKLPDGNWRYHKRTWEMSLFWWPDFRAPQMGLDELLAKIGR